MKPFSTPICRSDRAQRYAGRELVSPKPARPLLSASPSHAKVLRLFRIPSIQWFTSDFVCIRGPVSFLRPCTSCSTKHPFARSFTLLHHITRSWRGGRGAYFPRPCLSIWSAQLNPRRTWHLALARTFRSSLAVICPVTEKTRKFTEPVHESTQHSCGRIRSTRRIFVAPVDACRKKDKPRTSRPIRSRLFTIIHDRSHSVHAIHTIF